MFKTIAIAGTFDRLHKGHRHFIAEAFKSGKKVIIGLTSDEMANKKIRNKIKILGPRPISLGLKIQNFQTRKKELEGFLEKERLSNRVKIVKIDDVYGPSIGDNGIEAIIVTDDTLVGAKEVNKKRRELSLKPLLIIKVPLIMAEDQKRIASTRIRSGEIDRLGSVFQSHISENLRQELKKPLGKLIIGDPNNLMEIAEKLKKAVGRTNSTMISTVGDEVTKLCNEIGIPINLAIIDYSVNRQKKYESLDELGFKKKTPDYQVKNPAGHITQKLVDAVRKSYLSLMKEGKQHIIEVIGEEDLAGVPAILLAPLGSVILYGQPGQGVVMVEVTEAKKQEILLLINHCS